MNTFDYRIFIDDIPYSIFIDFYTDERKRIVINNQVILNEEPSNRLSDFNIYLPIKIKEHTITVHVRSEGENRYYDIFIDGISQIDGKSITEPLIIAKENTKDGILEFTKKQWKNILAEVLIPLVIACILNFLTNDYTVEDIKRHILLALSFLPVLFVIFDIFEYFKNKNIIKRFNKKFREEIIFKG